MKSSEKSHKASMNNFDKEYNRTEKEVYKKTQKREKIASKTALSAVIPAVLLILFISAFLVEPINKAVKKSKIDSSKVKISEQIYSYLDNGDYVVIQLMHWITIHFQKNIRYLWLQDIIHGRSHL